MPEHKYLYRCFTCINDNFFCYIIASFVMFRMKWAWPRDVLERYWGPYLTRRVRESTLNFTVKRCLVHSFITSLPFDEKCCQDRRGPSYSRGPHLQGPLANQHFRWFLRAVVVNCRCGLWYTCGIPNPRRNRGIL